MINNTPKAIDTHYNGYKFRSRTEARWAIFFDELNIAYDYEPQGFDLNGVRYLPDFQLTNGLVLHQFSPTQPDRLWVEIKPDAELSDAERTKLSEFVKQTSSHILLITGQPDINAGLRFIDHHPETGWLVIDVRWLELQDGQIGLVPVEKLNNNDLLIQTNTPRLRHALDKARQARFEFGQTPKPFSRQSLGQEQSEAIQAVTKTCKSCGKEFKPYRPHFVYCARCYRPQNKRRTEIAVASTNVAAEREAYQAPQPPAILPKKYGALLFVGAVFILLILGVFIALTQRTFGSRAAPSEVVVPVATGQTSTPDGLLASGASPGVFIVWDFEEQTRLASLDLTGNAVVSSGRDLRNEAFVTGNTGDNSRAWSFTHWAFASAPDNFRYVEFKVDTSNYQNISLSLTERRSNTGPLAFEIQYSTDGVNFTQIADTVTELPDNTVWRTHYFDLSDLTSQIAGQPSVQFRIYGYNASSAAGTWRLDDVTFTGR